MNNNNNSNKAGKTVKSMKRALNNKPVPDAKRARYTRSVRISNLPNSVKTINSEGKGESVVRASTTRRVLNKVAVRSNAEQQRALNVGSLVGYASGAHDTFDNMARSVYQKGTSSKLGLDIMDQAVGKLWRNYTQYNKNLKQL